METTLEFLATKKLGREVTDTGGASDHIFGLFALIGKRLRSVSPGFIRHPVAHYMTDRVTGWSNCWFTLNRKWSEADAGSEASRAA
ncbi:hypothetical protein DXT91_27210 [Agrobacterium tumefaciens]|nr:hypothetical protein [Rhizobium sp. AN67]MQB07745.1 hypothetical protein [Agrobacterium tumefaciens]